MPSAHEYLAPGELLALPQFSSPLTGPIPMKSSHCELAATVRASKHLEPHSTRPRCEQWLLRHTATALPSARDSRGRSATAEQGFMHVFGADTARCHTGLSQFSRQPEAHASGLISASSAPRKRMDRRLLHHLPQPWLRLAGPMPSPRMQLRKSRCDIHSLSERSCGATFLKPTTGPRQLKH